MNGPGRTRPRDEKQHRSSTRAYGLSLHRRLRLERWHSAYAQARWERAFAEVSQSAKGSEGIRQRLYTMVLVALAASLVLFTYASILRRFHW